MEEQENIQVTIRCGGCNVLFDWPTCVTRSELQGCDFLQYAHNCHQTYGALQVIDDPLVWDCVKCKRVFVSTDEGIPCGECSEPSCSSCLSANNDKCPACHLDVGAVLQSLGLPVKPCGLNADWSVPAWHLSRGTANITDGDFYLLDIEKRNDADEPLFEIVTRKYTANDPDGDGNDTITRIYGPNPLAIVLQQWRHNQSIKVGDTVYFDDDPYRRPMRVVALGSDHTVYEKQVIAVAVRDDGSLSKFQHARPVTRITKIDPTWEGPIILAASIKRDLLDILRLTDTERKLNENALADAVRRGEVKSFSVLHDYLDANVLGDYETLIPDYGEGDGNVQSTCDFLNAAQHEVDRWIQAGGLLSISIDAVRHRLSRDTMPCSIKPPQRRRI